jgi:hypothetical protein
MVKRPYPPHIHAGDDGRRPRDVYLDGKLLQRVCYADTRRGIVRVADYPYKVHKHGKRFITRTLRGVVEVRFRS